MAVRGLTKTIRDNYRGNAGRPSASEMNTIGALLKRADARGGIKLRQVQGGGLMIEGSGQSTRKASFWYAQGGSAGNLVAIYAGYIDYHGVGSYRVEGATDDDALVLTGGPIVWVYVWAKWSDMDDNGIAQAGGTDDDDRPISDSTHFKKVLLEFEYDPIRERYGRPWIRGAGRDVDLALPRRSL